MTVGKLIKLAVKQRLALSLAGALLVHAFFFGAGYWGIQQLLIPAKEDRTLVLTLEPTPLDGEKESAEHTQATVNNAALSQRAQNAKSDTSTIVEDPALSRTNKSVTDLAEKRPAAWRTASHNDSQQAADPIPDQSHALQPEPTEHVNTPQAAAAPDKVLKRVTHNDTSSEQMSPVNESRGQLSAARERPDISSAQAFLTSASSAMLVRTHRPTSQQQATPLTTRSEQKNNSQLSSKQQKQIEKKLTSWAQKLKEDTVIPESLNWEMQGQSYAVNIKQMPANNEMEMDELRVEVLTEQNGQQLTAVMRMKKLAFSNFAQFIHRWDPNVMMHNDEMTGRFHSNSSINIDYSAGAKPVFHNKVTTASYRVNIAGRSARKQVFRGGLETGVKRIRMPKPSVLFENLESDEKRNTVFFEQDTKIIFTKSGHYLWQNIGHYGPMKREKLSDGPTYIFGAAGKTLYVSGTVNGQIQVYSPYKIVIEDKLDYAEGKVLGSSKPKSLLGLVSDRNVEIAGKDVVPLGDLEIHAAIYAKRRFAVRNYRARRSGTLFIHGSLTAGSLSATEPRYATKIVFDKRLESSRPPGFPVTNRYEIDASGHQWKTQSVGALQESPYLEYEDIE